MKSIRVLDLLPGVMGVGQFRYCQLVVEITDASRRGVVQVLVINYVIWDRPVMQALDLLEVDENLVITNAHLSNNNCWLFLDRNVGFIAI